MAKSYFKFEELATFGHIVATTASCQMGTHFFTAANESVLEWNLRTRALVFEFKQGTESVTALCLHGQRLAVGHQDGSVRVWDLSSQSVRHTFEGHRTAVSALAFAADGLTLASGSQDTCIVLWDLVADAPTVKLQGHRDMVTCLTFLEGCLLSGSKDHMVKVWDVASESTVDTLVHSREVWSFAQVQAGTLLVGCADQTVHIWKKGESGYADVGTLPVEGLRGYIRTVALHPNKALVLVQSASQHFAVFRIRPEEELVKLEKRRHKRLREKGKEGEVTVLPADRFQLLVAAKAPEKISSAAFLPKTQQGKERELKASLAFCLSDNQVAVFSLEYNHTKSTKLPGVSSQLYSLSHSGHRSAVRALCLWTDASALVSGSSEAVKVWDLQTRTCTGSIASGYVVSLVCVQDGKHVVAGCKSGLLQVFDVSSLKCVQEVPAHEGAVWGLAATLSGQALVSGGADHEIRFWSLIVRKAKLNLQLADSMSLKDEVLAVSFTPNGKFICAALLDCTVQVLYADTHKFCLSLYAHKLPVTCFDVSSDSALLLSGSADKNVKIWGLDFGDCHKSILAHDQSIMAVKFVPETHYFFSASKDRLVKYWDADRFQLIMTLRGHHAEVWSLIVSPQGDFLVSAAGDFSIRVWSQTQEQLFLEEAREEEAEAAVAPEDLGLGGKQAEADLVLSTSHSSLKEGEQLMEALDSPSDGQLLKTLRGIRSATLDSALQLLPFHYVPLMLKGLLALARQGKDTELVAKCALTLVAIHESTIACALHNGEWLTLLGALKQELRTQIGCMRDNIGRNIAACQFLSAQH